MRDRTYLVDINKKIYETPCYKQFDNNIPFRIKIIENGVNADLTGYTIKAFFNNKSEIIQKNCTIKESIVETKLDNNILKNVGEVDVEFCLIKGEVILTTFKIVLKVEKSINRNEAVEKEAGWDIIKDFQTTLNNAINKAKEDVENSISKVDTTISDATNTVEQLEQDIATAIAGIDNKIDNRIDGKLDKSGGTMTGDLGLADKSLVGVNGAKILRDYGNGNVVIAAGIKSDGTAGILYLGYNSSTGFYTEYVRLESVLKWKGRRTLVDDDGYIPWSSIKGSHNHDSDYLGKTAKAESAKVSDTANAVSWDNVTGKPASFAPASHNHNSTYLGKTAKAESAKTADKLKDMEFKWAYGTGNPTHIWGTNEGSIIQKVWNPDNITVGFAKLANGLNIGNAPRVSNLNNITSTGFYAFSNGTINAPCYYGTIIHIQWNSDTATQICQNVNDPSVFWIRSLSGSWSAWRAV